MANVISYAERPGLEPLRLSNGRTSVLIELLSAVASARAQTPAQGRMAAWLASHDQGIFGRGMVGFDLASLLWGPERLEAERASLLQVIDVAKQRVGTSPHLGDPDGLRQALGRLEVLVRAYELRPGSPVPQWEFGEPPGELVRCARHGVIMHAYGCVVCNGQ